MTLALSNSGWGGIRTHERLSPLPVFKTGAFNRSATHPEAGGRVEDDPGRPETREHFDASGAGGLSRGANPVAEDVLTLGREDRRPATPTCFPNPDPVMVRES